MTDTQYDFGNFKKDALTKPRDKAWENWSKFDKVGKTYQGYIRDVFFRPAAGNFDDQRGITLEQPDGTLVNVGIKHLDFILKHTDGLRLNDPLTVVFEKELPPAIKTNSPTKQLAFYGKNLPENAGNKTVRELENEDRKLSEEADKQTDEEKEAAAQKAAEDKAADDKFNGIGAQPEKVEPVQEAK